MKNDTSSFSLQIGSLNFNSRSLGIITFAIFLMGILVGTYSIIHIDNPGISHSITVPVFFGAFIIPTLILFKGIRKAEKVTRDNK
ncbi:hypothetical protein [Fodinibius halophilus]|uniref:Uncharacterized protein n=1 Tax=Fodinibius halophilus TaxID=1736908 RepID=A0A6M1TA45_9BACT|nr:hypothetical protein [Fodinibius halophilus]NGP87222.1 hypothetical protein [Fodinibius halophilus]